MSENEILANELADDPDDYRVTLDLDDGTSTECAILTIFTLEDQDYSAISKATKNLSGYPSVLTNF